MHFYLVLKLLRLWLDGEAGLVGIWIIQATDSVFSRTFIIKFFFFSSASLLPMLVEVVVLVLPELENQID